MTWNNPWPVGSVSVKSNELTGTQNTAYLESKLKLNHFFNEANAGKHKFVELPIGSLPTGLASGEITLYAKIANGISELYATRGNTGVEIQMTSGNVGTSAAAGQSFLPGGFKLLWDFRPQTSSVSDQIVTFPFGGFINNCLQVYTQLNYTTQGSAPSGADSSIFILNNADPQPTKTDFKFTLKTNSDKIRGFFYIAIGN